jgi:ParB-like chromosome segregation protein Spo0J
MLIELSELELRYAALRVRDGGRAARMRASLAADGQQSAVIVIAHADSHRFVLIDGYLRVQATRVLARDVIEAVVLPLTEADALITAHRLEEVGRRSALEDGWLLEELIARHGLSQQDMTKRLSRSASWVCRRLALVHLVPEIAQAAVRDGFVPAQAAMKYLVPLSRDKRTACERIVQHLDFQHEPAVTEREVGRLYRYWRLGDAEQRKQIETQPRLFLRVEAAHAARRQERHAAAYRRAECHQRALPSRPTPDHRRQSRPRPPRSAPRAARSAARFSDGDRAHDGGVSCSTCTRARRSCVSRRRATECGRLRRR